MKTIIAPSLLAADFLNLEAELTRLEQASAEWLHLDIMDGNFVPNLTFAYDLVGKMRPKSTKVFDCHLMVDNPETYVENLAKAGAEYFVFHIEAVKSDQVLPLINDVKANGMKVGLAIKPDTEVTIIEQYLEMLDLVLVMSVEPGFGGQSFRENAVEKIAKLDELRTNNNYNYLIQVDGGINDQTKDRVKSAGCDVLVAGSYLFNDEMQSRIDLLKN